MECVAIVLYIYYTSLPTTPFLLPPSPSLINARAALEPLALLPPLHIAGPQPRAGTVYLLHNCYLLFTNCQLLCYQFNKIIFLLIFNQLKNLALSMLFGPCIITMYTQRHYSAYSPREIMLQLYSITQYRMDTNRAKVELQWRKCKAFCLDIAAKW